MSDSTAKMDSTKYRIPAGSAWSKMWLVAGMVGLLGLGVAAVGYTINPERFAYSYLFGWLTAFTLMIGSMFFVLVQHLTGAGWSVTVRRTAEFFTAGAVAIVILAIPIVTVFAPTLYPWFEHAADSHTAHAQEHADHADHGDHAGHGHSGPVVRVGAADHGASAAHGEHTPEHQFHADTLAKKAAYLNQNFFYIRAVLYFVFWLVLSGFLFNNSTKQDETKDVRVTAKLQSRSPVAMIFFALSLTFAGVDWVMSMEPNWFSTMFGVHLFASSAVTIHALIIVVTLSLKKAGYIGNEINVEHYHDLGKLQFGFLVFWAYISFCEFFLIWYAGIPEETVYFHRRWDYANWRLLSQGLIAFHFIFPFYLIMSRNAKRNPGMLRFGAAWILMVHVAEMYWLVLPYYAEFQDIDLNLVWLDVAALFGVVGLYLAVVFRRMLNHSLIPVGDPRLKRCLEFVNA